MCYISLPRCQACILTILLTDRNLPWTTLPANRTSNAIVERYHRRQHHPPLRALSWQVLGPPRNAKKQTLPAGSQTNVGVGQRFVILLWMPSWTGWTTVICQAARHTLDSCRVWWSPTWTIVSWRALFFHCLIIFEMKRKGNSLLLYQLKIYWIFESGMKMINLVLRGRTINFPLHHALPLLNMSTQPPVEFRRDGQV